MVGCLVGIFGGQRRFSVPPPQLDPPRSAPPTGPSVWAWPARAELEPSIVASGDDGVVLAATASGCAANDPLYQRVTDAQCVLRSQALFALMTQTSFPGAPRMHDGSDLSALLPPSRLAGESADLADSWRTEAMRRVRANTYVEDGDASWCSFSLESNNRGNTLRASCSLDRFGLYLNTPPRAERAQSCSTHPVESCGACESNEDCGASSDCGCAQSRCVRGQCSRCPAERTCSAPTFTVRAQPWVLTAPVSAANLPLVQALQGHPSSFRSVLHFAVVNANRDVRPGRGAMVEYDSGYRIGIRPLSFSVLLCRGDCRGHFRTELPIFTTPLWDTTYQSMRVHCVRGACSATVESLE